MQSRVVRKGAVLGERAAKQRARGLDCHCGHEMYVLASHKLLSCRPSLLHHSEQHLSCLVEFTSQAIWQGIRKTGKTACRKKKSRGMELVVGSASHLSPFFTAFVALALHLLFWKNTGTRSVSVHAAFRRRPSRARMSTPYSSTWPTSARHGRVHQSMRRNRPPCACKCRTFRRRAQRAAAVDYLFSFAMFLCFVT